MSDSNSGSNNGLSFFSVLGIVFIVLKLTGVIDWSWWYVTMPFWGSLALVSIVFVFVLLLLWLKEVLK